ncbi:ATP-binding protein [Caulobacter segnis]|uniref:ATP-binding protein n=1 Tax=Caulobacter segnis TaxID=88688 RepID=UPI0028578F67|nr:ATP-binding protein [Caulobacter segnis]MDR6626399.1 signal transduction histidine kinase/ActR/RegA family two-component response regulator [Caulobacter segnis]
MSRRGMAGRLVMTALVGVLLAYAFGPYALLPWIVVNAGLEGLLLLIKAQFRPASERRFPMIRRLGPGIAFSVTWSVTACLLWIHGSAGLKFAALMVMFGLLIEGLKYAVVSRALLLALAPAPFAALIFAAVTSQHWRGWEYVVLAVVMVGVLSFSLDAVRLLRANAQALEKAQAEAQEASRSKSAFVAMMSHELRTPMNGVLGLAHALSKTRLDVRQAEYVDMIIQSGDGLMTILNDILDLSKIEAGKLELEIAPFDIRALAGQIRLLWSETARTKGVDLSLEVDPATPAWLLGDAARVRQILMNLVSNALKFTLAGRVVIRVAPAEGEIVLSVADTGVGLTAEQRARLFAPFAQGDRSTARRFGGTGLGLAICRHLAELMDGAIGVDSEPGVGSTFTVRLALPATDAPSAEEGETGARFSLAGLRVLVVDDNAVNQLVARAVLEAAGIEVAAVGDGGAALARLGAEPFDMVLMDVHMPVMDGVEAVRRIRAGEGGRIDMPIVALTADAMVGDAERLMAQGFDDAHPKPIAPAGLLATVARLSAGSETRAAR